MPLVPTSATFLAVLSVPAEMSRSLNPEPRVSATVASSTPMRPAPPRQETSASVVVDLEPTLAMETLELDFSREVFREVSREVSEAGPLGLEVFSQGFIGQPGGFGQPGVISARPPQTNLASILGVRAAGGEAAAGGDDAIQA